MPIIIYLATGYLGDQAKIREKEAAKDRANQETLNSYLDEMTKLLPELRKEDSVDVKAIAKARTLTALRALDSERSTQLLGFLREAGLIGGDPSKAPKVDFRDVNLHIASLEKANLVGIDLSYANLSGANLSGAKLVAANLSNADLSNAKLDGADFSNADLTKATIRPIDQVTAIFCGAKLNKKGERSNQGCPKANATAVRVLIRSSPAGYVIGALAEGQAIGLTGAEQYATGRNLVLVDGLRLSIYQSNLQRINPVQLLETSKSLFGVGSNFC